MRALAILLAATVPGSAALSAHAREPEARAAGYRACEGIKDAGPTSADPADVKGLRARNVSCTRARRVARRWLSPFGNRRDGELVRFGAWTCADTIEARQRVRCKARGGKRVRFYLG